MRPKKQSILLTATMIDEAKFEIRWYSPGYLSDTPLTQMSAKEAVFTNLMMQTIEWFKMTARSNDMPIKIFVNEKEVKLPVLTNNIDKGPQKELKSN